MLSREKRNRRRRLVVEILEDRAVPATFGVPWNDPGHLTLSFAPDGTATQLTAGWQVLSFRALDPRKTVRSQGLIVRPYHPFTRASVLPVQPNTVYEVWVEVFPTAAQIASGDTLRINLTPADAPHLSPPLPQFQNEAGGTLSVYHDAQHPSAVVFPVEP